MGGDGECGGDAWANSNGYPGFTSSIQYSRCALFGDNYSADIPARDALIIQEGSLYIMDN